MIHSHDFLLLNLETAGHFQFLSTPVLMHGGLMWITLRLSVRDFTKILT